MPVNICLHGKSVFVFPIQKLSYNRPIVVRSRVMKLKIKTKYMENIMFAALTDTGAREPQKLEMIAAKSQAYLAWDGLQ